MAGRLKGRFLRFPLGFPDLSTAAIVLFLCFREDLGSQLDLCFVSLSLSLLFPFFLLPPPSSPSPFPSLFLSSLPPSKLNLLSLINSIFEKKLWTTLNISRLWKLYNWIKREAVSPLRNGSCLVPSRESCSSDRSREDLGAASRALMRSLESRGPWREETPQQRQIRKEQRPKNKTSWLSSKCILCDFLWKVEIESEIVFFFPALDIERGHLCDTDCPKARPFYGALIFKDKFFSVLIRQKTGAIMSFLHICLLLWTFC